MKQIIKYQSDDGKTYDSEMDALRADAVYHKERSNQLARLEEAQKRARHTEPGYRVHDGGGHT